MVFSVGFLLIIFGVFLAVGIIILVAALIASSGKEEPDDSVTSDTSYFDGTTLQLIGWRLLAFLINSITLYIAYPWTACMLARWETKHTVINGRRLAFTGKGSQLFGRYILWIFLTIITFGIYSIWLSLGIKKWLVKHTVYADGKGIADSYFSGGAGGFLGIHILQYLITAATFGFGAAWGQKKVLEWEAKHTHIGGSPLVFQGTGGQLFIKYLLFAFLTPLTLGIYAIFFPVIIMKWKYSHTVARYRLPEFYGKSHEHEAQAIADYARFRMNANEVEMQIIKSGINGNETCEQLMDLANAGNAFAKYKLATILKEQQGETADVLEMIKAGCDANYHPAMMEYSEALIDPAQKNALLEAAAKQGSPKAPWMLATLYLNSSDVEQLKLAAYWFRLALEWEDEEAKANEEIYKDLVTKIALLLSERDVEKTKSSTGIIIAGVAGGLILLILIASLLAAFLGIRKVGRPMQAGPSMETVCVQSIDIN